MLSKKAAMFGLDARIALAIFGALSIITGAALYSTLDKLTATQMLADMQEIAKAYEQYYIDTRQPLPRGPTSTAAVFHYVQNAKFLVNNPGYKGWKGPYTSWSIYDDARYPELLYRNSSAKISIIQVTDKETWSGDWNTGKCENAVDCSLWILFAHYPDPEVFKKIDVMVDGKDSPSSGNFRWHKNNTYRGFLKFMHSTR